MKKFETITVILILAVAASFRLINLESAPPGLLAAEALNGNRAIAIAEQGSFLSVFNPTTTGERGLLVVLQSFAVRWFGNTAFSLRIISALAGILTVWGVYLFARRLFSHQIGAIAAFLMAISLWHVMFSRLGLRMILVPLFAVWGLYFFWLGLSSARLKHFVFAALCWGAGLYTHSIFLPLTLVLIATLGAYWHAISKDFNHARYVETRLRLIRGLALFLLITILLLAPLGYYGYTRSEQLAERWWNASVFAADYPWQTLLARMAKGFSMLIIGQEQSWTFGIASSAILFWPVAPFFAIGFLKSWIKLARAKKRHGHVSTVQVLLLSWFLVGLAFVALKNGPVSLPMLLLPLAPVVFMFAAEGLWWLFEYLEKWYYARDVHDLGFLPVHAHRAHLRESILASSLIIVLFLAALGIAEYGRYFRVWAQQPEVAAAYLARAHDIAAQIAQARPQARKYVVVPYDPLLIDGFPLSGQPVMYLTDTATPEKQRARNLYYLTEEQYRRGAYQAGSAMFFLNR